VFFESFLRRLMLAGPNGLVITKRGGLREGHAASTVKGGIPSSPLPSVATSEEKKEGIDLLVYGGKGRGIAGSSARPAARSGAYLKNSKKKDTQSGTSVYVKQEKRARFLQTPKEENKTHTLGRETKEKRDRTAFLVNTTKRQSALKRKRGGAG